LVAEIGNEDLKLKYNTAKYDSTRNLLNLVNFAIKKNFKLKVNFEDMIVAVSTDSENKKVEKEETSKQKTGKGKDQNIHNLVYNKNSLNIALKSIRLDEMKRDVIIGFQDASMYDDIIPKEGQIDDEMFTKEKYPIVFTESTSSSSYDNIIDYVETTKRLVKFILMDGSDKVPQMKDGTPIAVGAPFQNLEILEETSEALDGWYKVVIEYKALYLDFMQKKISIFSAAVPSKHIADIKNEVFNQLNIIGTTNSTVTQKDLNCQKLINKIINKYADYRKQEIRLIDDKSIMVDNKIAVLGNKPDDYPKQTARAMKRLHFGIEAVLTVETAKYSYQLFKELNPGLTLCSDFEGELEKRMLDKDKDMNSKVSKILTRKLSEIERKYGSNAIRGSKALTGILTLLTAPVVPREYLEDIFTLLSSASASSLGIATISSAPGTSYKKMLTYEQKTRVENPVFWKQLFSAFNNRVLLIPVVKQKANRNVDVNNFYLIDVLGSMVDGKLYRISFAGNIIDILRKFYDKAYILFTNTSSELATPANWKALDHDVLVKTLKKGNSDRFDNIAKIRDLFFNFLANYEFYTNSANVPISATSKISQLLQVFCKDVLQIEKFNKCNLLISRDIFVKNIQPKVSKYDALRGIDFASGTAYAQYKLLGNTSNVLTRN